MSLKVLYPAQLLKYRMPVTESLKVQLFQKTCSGNGYKVQGLPQSHTQVLRAVYEMLLMPFYQVRMDGCLTGKMHWAK